MYKKWKGLFFEDFIINDIYEHPFGRTIIEADNVWFTNLTMNTQQLHYNKDYAKQTEFKVPLVNSCLTLSVLTGLSVIDLGYNLIANLEWNEVKCSAPVYIDDTLYAKSVILKKQELKSKPKAGIIEVKTIGANQDGKIVMEFKRKFMVKKEMK